jgi:hypothetical protein
MAHQWFLQHAGKQYGPLTSAQLKKLAGDGKITPASQIRLGAEGAWGPASRVQGLFPAPPESSLLDELDALPPVAPPPAPPPLASPLARVPMGAIAAVNSKAPAASAPIAGKLLGAVGLIFGTLALSTFWLPMLGGPMSWTGIVVGGLGLVLGIAGLVVAAMQNGAGLFLNVAAASSSVLGLVLTVVLGITFGMFSAAKPVAVVPAPVLAQPEPIPVVDPEPEPAPPPEPVWMDASQPIEQPPIKATIVGVTIETMRLESASLTQIARSKPEKKLRVRVAIENVSMNQIVAVPGWNGGGALPDGVGDLLKGSELGGQLSAATATAVLTDNIGNNYPQVPALRLPAAQADLNPNPAVRPGQKIEKLIVFDHPLDSVEYLRLELPSSGFSGAEPLRFQIPKSMLPATTP